MKTRGKRLLALIFATAALFDMHRTGLRSRTGEAHGDNPERGDVPGWVMITFVTGT